MRNRVMAGLVSLAVVLTGSLAISSPALAVTTYHYAIGQQTGIIADGAAVNLTAESPHVNSAHDGANSQSLAELAVSSADGKNRIEAGWRKTATGGPYLFVYHVVNSVGMGYNLCNDYAANPVNAGAAIPAAWVGDKTNMPRFQIIHSGSSWWIAMSRTVSGVTEGGWVCSFPDTTWTSQAQTFNKVNTVQAYGEVASTTSATPCSDMGDGQDASSGTAARIGSYSLQGQTSGPAATFFVYTQPSTVGITTSIVSGQTFRYGWKGYSAANTLPGIVGC